MLKVLNVTLSRCHCHEMPSTDSRALSANLGFHYLKVGVSKLETLCTFCHFYTPKLHKYAVCINLQKITSISCRF